jgi:hypothetical protein
MRPARPHAKRRSMSVYRHRLPRPMRPARPREKRHSMSVYHMDLPRLVRPRAKRETPDHTRNATDVGMPTWIAAICAAKRERRPMSVYRHALPQSARQRAVERGLMVTRYGASRRGLRRRVAGRLGAGAGREWERGGSGSGAGAGARAAFGGERGCDAEGWDDLWAPRDHQQTLRPGLVLGGLRRRGRLRLGTGRRGRRVTRRLREMRRLRGRCGRRRSR